MSLKEDDAAEGQAVQKAVRRVLAHHHWVGCRHGAGRPVLYRARGDDHEREDDEFSQHESLVGAIETRGCSGQILVKRHPHHPCHNFTFFEVATVTPFP